jgi:hypothetical protein
MMHSWLQRWPALVGLAEGRPTGDPKRGKEIAEKHFAWQLGSVLVLATLQHERVSLLSPHPAFGFFRVDGARGGDFGLHPKL